MPTSSSLRASLEQLYPAGLITPAILIVGFVLVLPLGWLGYLSFIDDTGQTSLVNYAVLLNSTAYLQTLETTVALSLTVAVLVVVLGYPLAYWLAHLSRRTSGLLLILVLIPFWTSSLVRTYAWLILLQRRGVVNNALLALDLIGSPLRLANSFTGITIGVVHVSLPIFILPTLVAIRGIQRDLSDASLGLGAGPMRTFLKVFLPLSLPGAAAGLVLTFVMCLGFYITPILLGGGRVVVWSMMIDVAVQSHSSWGSAGALGVMLLVACFALLASIRVVTRRVFKVGAGH